MSYQANPYEDRKIRQRIREILNEKIQDRTYKGAAVVGGRKYKESTRVRRDRAERERYRMLGGVEKEKKTAVKKTAVKKKAVKKKAVKRTKKMGIPEEFFEKIHKTTGKRTRLNKAEKEILISNCYRAKNPNRVKAGKKSGKKNPWLAFYSKWVSSHPKMSGREASKLAAIDYHAQKGSGMYYY